MLLVMPSSPHSQQVFQSTFTLQWVTCSPTPHLFSFPASSPDPLHFTWFHFSHYHHNIESTNVSFCHLPKLYCWTWWFPFLAVICFPVCYLFLFVLSNQDSVKVCISLYKTQIVFDPSACVRSAFGYSASRPGVTEYKHDKWLQESILVI